MIVSIELIEETDCPYGNAEVIDLTLPEINCCLSTFHHR